MVPGDRRLTRLIVGLCALGSPLALMGQTRAIADNSFLIEEAFNQEPGVVQHISVFQLFRPADTWTYSFTQEWPLFGQGHQLSYTVPVQRTRNGSSVATGLGEVAVNYRYQLVGGATDRLFVAPRLSGIRWAHDLFSGLQIVPGIAFPLDVGPTAGTDAVLLYLSFEHPFRRIEH